ncbi:MAG: hypothetical protein LH468_01270 [Nocardioides sp.]|nr:hypothetical protein [Nocardioides sp.]
MSSSAGIHLVRTAENVAEIEALAGLVGGRAGLAAMLDDLDRQGRRALAPGLAVHRAWTWDRADRRDRRWWPQGVSTSADAAGSTGDGQVAGRSVVAVAWYARKLPGEAAGQGSRVSFFDLDSRRYRHVLLVVPRLRDGQLGVEPLRVHAGGIVWAGPHLHVAATTRGLMTCRLEDLMQVPASALGDDRTLGVDGDRVSSFGYRWVLPVRFAYRSVTDDGLQGLRYSFASLDRAADPPALLVGEYGRRRQTTRLARFPLDEESGLLATDEDGRSSALALHDGGVTHSQGVAVAAGHHYVTVSRGTRTPGSVYVGAPGAFRELRWAVPMGPEDIAFWPARDQLFTATEHPRRRWIVAMRRSRFDRLLP